MSPDNLGTLKTLPGEIRALIWRELRPSRAPIQRESKGETAKPLGILSACRQLNDEIIPYLYDKETLEIRLGHDHHALFTIQSTAGAKWHFLDGRGWEYQAFRHLPWKKLRAVRIVIDAPEANNTDQFVGLLHNILELVRLLVQADGLPPLEISLLDAPLGNWAQQQRQTIGPISIWSPMCGDCPKIIRPFYRLHGMKQISLDLPECLINRHSVVEEMEMVMMRDNGESHWDDEFVQQGVSHFYQMFEKLLDDIPGSTANFLRRERFMNWYGDNGELDYLNKYLDWMGQDFQCDPFDYSWFLWVKHDELLALNPLSATMQINRLQLDLTSHHRRGPFLAENRWDLTSLRNYFETVEKYKDDFPLQEYNVAAAARTKPS
ncbi:hypothetical protein LZ554_008378 [Drepanopeziza brunnea f. sp. 'monogermtubi']|nr:hypothetical protein LZ554_008378 [Drepanopeziza brunnea f. sp. 'monogermtubi']